MTPMLSFENVNVAIADVPVLRNLSFALQAGASAALIGRNGAGKTTTLRAIMGIVPQCRGSVVFRDREIAGLASNRIARLGIAYCPEERSIFASLDVEENLLLPPAVLPGGMSVGEIYAIFPTLEERRRSQGTKLSGGEQQMLAIGRSLMTNPKLIILDEATEGLAPLIRNEIWASLKRLKAEGQAILLVDKHIDALLKLADRHVVIEKGYVVWSGSSAALMNDPTVRQRYLQV